MRSRIIVAALAAACAGSAVAQSAGAGAKRELATKVVQAHMQGIENVGKVLAAQTVQRELQAASRLLARMPADKRDAAAKDVEAEVKKVYDEIEPLLRERAVKLGPATLTPLFEDRFSEDELRQILAWVQSPVSKKYGQIDAEITKALAEKVVADARPVVDSRLRQLGSTVSARLGVSPASAAASAPAAPKK